MSAFEKKFIAYLFSFYLSLVIVPTIHAASCAVFTGSPGNLCQQCSDGIDGNGNSCSINGVEGYRGKCNSCIGINPDTNRYEYYRKESFAVSSGNQCVGDYDDTFITSLTPLNTDITDPGGGANGCYFAASAPAGCNNGMSCGSGGGGQQCGEYGYDNPPLDCPAAYEGDNCGDIPCGWRPACNCECTCNNECEGNQLQCDDAGGGGGPSPTPTPTPTPYCTLSCPSAGSSGGGTGDTGTGSGTGGTGIGGSGSSNPLRASGNLSYSGFNGFSCDNYENGWVTNLLCSLAGHGAGGGTGAGASGSESWDEPVTYNMLCGEQETTYTALVNGSSGGASSGASSGGGRGISPTAGPTPTYALYPPGCSIGGSPTATTAPGHGGSGGSSGGDASSGALSCSCTSTLSCPLTRMVGPSDPSSEGGECVPSVCDFTVNPELPIFSTEVIFDLDIQEALNERSIDFEDNAGVRTLSSSATQTTNTFANAGAYNVTLTCSNGSGSALSCSRLVNVYCNNGVAPSPSPTPDATTSWFKLKDTSFIREDVIGNSIPSGAVAYDSDDVGICSLTDSSQRACMSSGVAGTTLSEGAISVGDGTTSPVGWQKADTTIIKRFSPVTFLSYVKARKYLTTITDFSDISGKKIYLYVGNMTLSNADVASVTDDFVLVVQGNLTISDNLTNLEDQSAAFISTGGLNIQEAVDELHGIYVATTVDFASDASLTATPLKIVGNIISRDATDLTKRVRSDTSRPSLFVTLDMRPYLDLLPLLSVRNTQQEELAQ